MINLPVVYRRRSQPLALHSFIVPDRAFRRGLASCPDRDGVVLSPSPFPHPRFLSPIKIRAGVVDGRQIVRQREHGQQSHRMRASGLRHRFFIKYSSCRAPAAHPFLVFSDGTLSDMPVRHSACPFPTPWVPVEFTAIIPPILLTGSHERFFSLRKRTGNGSFLWTRNCAVSIA
jgi:hypothetical protein